MMKLKQVTITASRTLQIVQYEPLTFTLSEVYEVDAKLSDESVMKTKRKLTKQLGRMLENVMATEAERYRE